MNFFEQQEEARQRSRTLVILFILAVIAILVAVNLALALVWSFMFQGNGGNPVAYPRGFFVTNTVITLALIGIGTLIEMFNLRDGGDAVARMAGGRLVMPSSQDLQERRLLNVVEEMALASGIACPRVYVLDKEESINAFAAGYNQNEAVVAVTRGTLFRLNRDELQGVVAHEFSHILNGDMRLNIRLISVLFGIQMIASFGQQLMQAGSRVWVVRSRNDKGPPVQLVLIGMGGALFAIGYIGIIFGRLIKSAVLRQREFLADASAVQFTRSADGIGNALRKIGGLSRTMSPGSRIDHPNAEHLSHLFLGAPRQSLMSGWLATHPPIEERLRRIYGKHVGMLDAPAIPDTSAMPESFTRREPLPDIAYTASGFAAPEGPTAYEPSIHASAPGATSPQGGLMDSGLPALAFGAEGGRQTPLSPALESAMREPYGASALVYALFLENGPERVQQLAVLKKETPQQAGLVAYLAGHIASLPKSARLPLLDLAMPALHQLSETQRTVLIAIVDKMIAADSKMTLTEFVLETVLMRRLDPAAGRPNPIRYGDLLPLRRECAMLLSLMAHVAAHDGGARPEQAFLQGAAWCPELKLASDDLIGKSSLQLPVVRNALERLSHLAPLPKPLLIKALLATVEKRDPMPVASADLLRAICAAMDSPVPPEVASTYTAYHW